MYSESGILTPVVGTAQRSCRQEDDNRELGALQD